MKSTRSSHKGISEKKFSSTLIRYTDVMQGGKKVKDRRASSLSHVDASPPEDHQEILRQYLRLPQSQYDYLGDLIEFERPGLTKIHRFVRAMAFGKKPDNDFLLALAAALAEFLKPGSLKVQQARFAKHLHIVRRQGRKTPAQGEPIKEVVAAKVIMDLLDTPDHRVKRKDAIERACDLFHRDYRTVERWYDTHKKWVAFVYAWRKELRDARLLTTVGRKSLRHAEDYIARLEGGLRLLAQIQPCGTAPS